MTINEVAFELDELTRQTWALGGVALAIQTAVTSGAYVAEDYEPALFALTNMASDLERRLTDATDALFAVLKEGC